MNQWRKYRKAIIGTLAALGVWLAAIQAYQPTVTPPAIPVALQGKRHVVLTNSYTTTVTVGGVAHRITVPRGFVSDFASVPERLEPALGLQWDAPCLRRGALLHDWLYSRLDLEGRGTIPKATADLILWQAILNDGCVPAKAEAVYEAVRLWGFTALGR